MSLAPTTTLLLHPRVKYQIFSLTILHRYYWLQVLMLFSLSTQPLDAYLYINSKTTPKIQTFHRRHLIIVFLVVISILADSINWPTLNLKKKIRSGYYSRTRITVSHHLSIVCTTSRSISTTKNQRGIYHYSFRFHSRFILGKTKEFISYENFTILHNRPTINESSFRRGITIELSFFYHTYFFV